MTSAQAPTPPAATEPSGPGAATVDPAGTDAPLQRLLEQVRAAHADASALRIRGGDTKDFYGAPGRGTPIDTAHLRGICSYEPTEMVITARAGTPLAELESALAERGQCLAFEPPRFGANGTVGGMVAAGLSGPARASCGSVRDFVLGAVLINGQAQLLRFGGQVMKNVAGYDVARVLPGSLGILGIICEVSLKVLPVPPARATLVFSCPQAQAIEQLHRWSAAALPISASVWQAEHLHVRLAGAAAAVRAASARLAAQSGGQALDAAAAEAFWSELRDQRSAYFTHAAAAMTDESSASERRLWRLSVPSLQPPMDLPGEVLVEWGGAQRWLLSDAPIESIQSCASRAGGHASIFRARQRPLDFLPRPSENLMQLHKSLKQAFDPKGIFNQGRLYSWL
jgi:FAD/FMN-containing dehydrogenase